MEFYAVEMQPKKKKNYRFCLSKHLIFSLNSTIKSFNMFTFEKTYRNVMHYTIKINLYTLNIISLHSESETHY